MMFHRIRVIVSFICLVSTSHAADTQALTPAQTIVLPGVEGRIDHLTADVKAKRLFVAALGNNSVEIIDLVSGKRTESIKGLKEPQGIRFLADDETLFIGSGGSGSCEVFDAKSLKSSASVKLGGDADNVRYDPESRRMYVGYGEGAIGVIDALKRTKVADIPLKAHPEAFQLESKGNRIFVNVPGAMQIVVIDRTRNQVTATWPVHEAHGNFPMALDEARHRLFIGCRKPARLLLLDTDTGKVVTSSDCGGDTDDLFYDADTQRVYVTCGEGFIDVYDCADGDTLARVQHLATATGARTSLLVPELKALYLAVPHRGSQKAEIRVYNTMR